MKTIQLDADILFGLFKRVSPSAHKHLVKQGVEPLMFMTEWFLCVFSRTLPWPSVLRVWDMFMCEGVKVIFKVYNYLTLDLIYRLDICLLTLRLGSYC